MYIYKTKLKLINLHYAKTINSCLSVNIITEIATGLFLAEKYMYRAPFIFSFKAASLIQK